MTFNQPQSKLQQPKGLDDLSRDLSQAIAEELGRPAAAAPRGVPEGRGRGPMWGPTTPSALTPMQLLLEVANNAHTLQREVASLAEALTGEPLPIHNRPVEKLPASLLPAVGRLADEIGRVHAEIGRTIQSLRGRL